jgi:hypothetical protein
LAVVSWIVYVGRGPVIQGEKFENIFENLVTKFSRPSSIIRENGHRKEVAI